MKFFNKTDSIGFFGIFIEQDSNTVHCYALTQASGREVAHKWSLRTHDSPGFITVEGINGSMHGIDITNYKNIELVPIESLSELNEVTEIEGNRITIKGV